MRISGNTKVVGIFGDPIEQSLSPYMHNAAFDAMGIGCVYVPFHVRSDAIEDALGAVKALDMRGVNLTIPHKELALEFLDEVDKEAADIGAVNTVVNKDGRLIGYNTDGRGYLESLKLETDFDPKGKSIVVVGAGGSARSISYTFALEGVSSVTLLNRTVERAKALADEYSKKFPDVEFNSGTLTECETYKDADLFVNTTSMGMLGKGGADAPIDVSVISTSAIVSDIVFMPIDTPFIKAAEARGIKTHKGLGMLIHQGVLSFELWFEEAPPVDVMRFAAVQALEVRQSL